MYKAVFLDRDGTLIEDHGHLSGPSEVVFFPDTIGALRRLQEHFLLFIVTNQPGVSEGIVSQNDVERVNTYVVRRLADADVGITNVYVCPHGRSDGCQCIKPNPYFLHMAARKYNIDLGNSFVVGDHPHDVQLARNVGAVGIYVLTGHGEKHHAELPLGTAVTAGISQAAELIVARHNSGKLSQELQRKITRAARILSDGGVVAFPTETVYGLGANALNPLAVARVFEIKGRPLFDPLIVHIARHDDLGFLVATIPQVATNLIERFWPGPLTIVLRKRIAVPGIVTAGLPTVAIRMPNHCLAQELIRQAGVPIAAPSANLFGRLSPTTAIHVAEQLAGKVDLILDDGACSVGIESTIVSVVGEQPVILRLGGTTVEEIEEVIGPVDMATCRQSYPLAPGMLPRHYAPRTPLVLGLPYNHLPGITKVGLLSFRACTAPNGFAAVEVLSKSGNLREAAANLFACLRRLDAQDLHLIVCEPVPQEGLGRAIMDRLRRASAEQVARGC